MISIRDQAERAPDAGTPDGRLRLGTTFNNLGTVYQSQERWSEAEDCYRQSLVIKREFGDRVGEGRTLRNLALLQEARGDVAGGPGGVGEGAADRCPAGSAGGEGVAGGRHAARYSGRRRTVR